MYKLHNAWKRLWKRIYYTIVTKKKMKLTLCKNFKECLVMNNWNRGTGLIFKNLLNPSIQCIAYHLYAISFKFNKIILNRNIQNNDWNNYVMFSVFFYTFMKIWLEVTALLMKNIPWLPRVPNFHGTHSSKFFVSSTSIFWLIFFLSNPKTIQKY